MDLEDKINIVKNILKNKKVAIAFSGGADSTLLAYLSSKFAEDVLAITINNGLFPTNFIENTVKTTKSFGITHEIVNINFYDDEDFLSNRSSRCYTCRDLMYSTVKNIAKENDFDFICDGNNISDLIIDRPGILITYKNGFNTPFIDAKLTSKEIHEYLNDNNISYSKSTTCLATRIPTNTQTTKDKIRRISHCEDYILENTNCEIVKVRDLDDYCILEVDRIEEILKEDKFIQINDELKQQGFKKVTLNLSQIDDDESISIDYKNGGFAFELPFEINLENTKNQINEKIISYTEEKLELEKISIYKNGLIKGHDFKTYESAFDAFMEILKKIRREI